MNLDLDVEFYPKLRSDTIKQNKELIYRNRKNWQEPFFTDTKSYLDIEEIKNESHQFMDDKLQNVIILGTGGSIQTLLALKHLSKKKIFPITSSRSVELINCLNKTTPRNSLVIPISRGGETLDINSTIGTFIDNGYNFLGLSSRGTMNDLLKQLDCPILDVPDLSGRFAGSITNVAIVPAYISGIKINEFLTGLEDGYHSFINDNSNYAIELASYIFELYKKGLRVIFSMPYSKNIEGLVGLLAQEISESSGKDGKGMMGTFHSAPLSQHSVLEYLLGGKKGVVIPILWTISQEMNDLNLKSSINYVNGRPAQEIVNYQADATFQALLEQSVPSIKIELKNYSEYNIGTATALIQSIVYYFCLLLDVNWANNPKVNIGKKICNEALKQGLSPKRRKDKRKEIAENKFKTYFN